MKQLSYLDASFLYLESNHAPMHVGGTFVFQQPTNGKMTFSRFKQHIASRLQTSPIFRQRLIEMPLAFDLPYWVEDGQFDLDDHVFSHRLSKGSAKELQSQAEEFFSLALDRDKPLWEIMFVEGLKSGGDFAFIIKVHHCAIDGVSGEEVLVGLLDFSDTPKSLPEDTWQPEPIPHYSSLLGKKLNKSRHVTRQIWQLLKNTGRTVNSSVSLRRHEEGISPPLFFTSPPTLFNVAVDNKRRLSHAHLPLKQIKEIKNAQNSLTINDVVLTICSSALEKYLVNQNALPDTSLVAMTPISMRKTNDSNKSKDHERSGNEVSAMLVSLETNESDLLKRLVKIHNNSRKGKIYNRSVAAEQLLNDLPPMTSALVTRTFTTLKLSQHLKPIFNVVITNVPGSSVPLYLDGAKLVSQTFNAPIYDYTGLTINVTSYTNTLTIGITTTPDIVPNGEKMINFIKEAFTEMYQEIVGKTVDLELDIFDTFVA